MIGHSKKEISGKEHLRASQGMYSKLIIHGKNFGFCMYGWKLSTGFTVYSSLSIFNKIYGKVLSKRMNIQ